MNAEQIARALGGARRSGNGWRCRCPAHDDRTPSLSITERGDRLLVRCHANCSQKAVIGALRQRGLWPEPRSKDHKVVPAQWTPILPVPDDAPRQMPRHPQHGKPSAHWPYKDVQGRLLGLACRFDHKNGSKEIRPLTFCKGSAGKREWRWQGFPEPRPLYGLDRLAQRPDPPVLVAEGEKSANGAQELFTNYVAITWPGGAKAVAKADWRLVQGRRVVIWPDADPEGQEAAKAVARACLAAGASEVTVVTLPDNLPKGWDLADDPPPGWDADRLRELLADARDVRQAELARLGIVTAAELTEREFQEPRWIVRDMLPEGCGFLAGKPKTGKSWLVLDLAVAVASDGLALGRFEVGPGEVLLLGLEDTERRLQGRLRALLQGAPAPRNLHLVTRWRPADEGGIDDLRLWLRTHPGAVLVIVDTFARMRGQANRAEGAYQNDYRAVTPFKAIADEFGVTLLLVHHQRKEKAEDPLETISGTGGLTGAADTVLVLKREPGSPYAVLYARGRDVPEREIALQFESATGKWLALGPAEDWRKSQERKELVRALIDAGPMSPAELAKEIGKTRKAVQRMLAKMAKSGEIVALGNGDYMVPSP